MVDFNALAQSPNMRMSEIGNQNETAIAGQGNIIAVNLTGIVNQTDDTLLGFLPISPRFCEGINRRRGL